MLIHAKLLSDQTKKLEGRTDKDGRVSLTLPVGGAWMLNAVEMVKAPDGMKINEITPDWESLWASLTFETADAPKTAKPAACACEDRAVTRSRERHQALIYAPTACICIFANLRGSVRAMMSLTPSWLKPLKPSLRSRFSRC